MRAALAVEEEHENLLPLDVTSEQSCIHTRSRPWRFSLLLVSAAGCLVLAAAALCQSSRPAPRPANARTLTKGRKGSFIVLGDWGWDFKAHGDILSNTCQHLVAQRMAETMEELGDVRFIVNVGDSFYPGGVRNKDDPQWEEKWRKIYAPHVRSVPWYSVYGNHDLHKDPCACSDNLNDCAQIHGDIHNLSYFYMPEPSWWRGHPELDLEVVALDLNHYVWGWKRDLPEQNRNAQGECGWSLCPEMCVHTLEQRTGQAMDLFYTRIKESKAKNMIVFSHYPTDYFWSAPSFLGALSDGSKRHIEYFGGHRHSVDQESTIPILPNNNWLSGGGGGWGCEAYKKSAGFVVGEILADGSIETYAVNVDPDACCG